MYSAQMQGVEFKCQKGDLLNHITLVVLNVKIYSCKNLFFNEAIEHKTLKKIGNLFAKIQDA